MNTTEGAPQVWIGCLACYNDGHLVGEWFDAIDCPESEEEFAEAVQGGRERLAKFGHDASHEELWCMDHQGFEGFLTGECSPSEAKKIAEKIDELDYRPVAAVAAFLSNTGDNIDELDLDAFDEAFCGEYDSERDYAMELADEVGDMDSDAGQRWPFTCIDWDQAARELFIGGDNWSTDATEASGWKIYVFRSF